MSDYDSDEFTYLYCGKKNATEYHVKSGHVYITLITSPNTEKHYKGFRLDYNNEGINENQIVLVRSELILVLYRRLQSQLYK